MIEEKALFLTENEEISDAEESVAGPVHPMTALLEEAENLGKLERGKIVEGIIVHISSNEVLIDINAKSEGIVTKRDLERLGPESLAELKVGDTVLSSVLTPEDKNGNIILSLTKAQVEKDWREAERLFKAQEGFEGSVAGYNKGGLIVRLGRVRGFVPSSQLVPKGGGDFGSEEYKAKLVGQDIQLKVIELDRDRNRLILSERAAVRDWRRMRKDKLLESLNEGDIRRGIVSSLCDFGAFVDLGEADGLVHLSELSWRRVAHPNEVLSVGQEVEVYVLNVDRERKRIGLSLKRLASDPWTLADELFQVGQLVEGTITKLVKFGAFARLSDSDIEGLIHVSELSEEHVTHPKEIVSDGDVLTLRVIKIDSARRRMGLSLKRVASADYAEQDWDVSRGENVTVTDNDKQADSEGVAQEQAEASFPESIEEEAAEDVLKPANEEEIVPEQVEVASSSPESIEVETAEGVLG